MPTSKPTCKDVRTEAIRAHKLTNTRAYQYYNVTNASVRTPVGRADARVVGCTVAREAKSADGQRELRLRQSCTAQRMQEHFFDLLSDAGTVRPRSRVENTVRGAPGIIAHPGPAHSGVDLRKARQTPERLLRCGGGAGRRLWECGGGANCNAVLFLLYCSTRTVYTALFHVVLSGQCGGAHPIRPPRHSLSYPGLARGRRCGNRGSIMQPLVAARWLETL